MKKYIRIFLILIMFVLIFNPVMAVEERLEPMKEQLGGNISTLTASIIIMLVVFFVLSIIEKVMTGKKIIKNRFSSNIFVRFVEVLLFVIITVLMMYEFININNIYVKCIGIVVALFALYQRISNKNRKWAYTTFIIDVGIYAIEIIFKL